MKNENRAVFDRASEHDDLIFELGPLSLKKTSCNNAIVVAPPTGRTGLGKLLKLFVGALRMRRNRMALLELSDDQLKDIGISRSQAYGGYSCYRRSVSHGLERKSI